MFRDPDYRQHLSLKLSEVLDDIGVNEEMVRKRRDACQLQETVTSITMRYTHKTSTDIFGSLSEGTTTKGLNSDIDIVNCIHKYNAIQDLTEWKRGFVNLLMIKDKNTPSGYCLLQRINDAVPFPATYSPDRHYVKDSNGRALLRNIIFGDFISAAFEKHGPSYAIKGYPSVSDTDTVPAFHRKSWPHEALPWIDRQGKRKWPTADIMSFAVNNGCYVVPIGSKVGQNPELEWRISTSQAERYLMFSLNITQIRCFVFMKKILKTFFRQSCEGYITSYMCKTILFYCIERTSSNTWRETNLVTCLTLCLNCLQEENCPHFIIPGNNLMAGQFSPEVKAELLQKLSHVIKNVAHIFLKIQIDDVGKRLQTTISRIVLISSKRVIGLQISGRSLCITAESINRSIINLLIKTVRPNSFSIEQYLVRFLANCSRCNREGYQVEQTASILLAPFVFSTLGTVIGSIHVKTNTFLSQEALVFLLAGCKSDAASGKLKLASVSYSMRNMVSSELILRNTERHYDLKTRDELLHRDKDSDAWMGWTVVDCLPFLYFLQYKTYAHLQRIDDQHRALDNLTEIIKSGKNLGHRETALNLLGQCMEQKNQHNKALHYYMLSLKIRERINAARIHICILLTKLVRDKS